MLYAANRVNKVVLIYTCALARFLHKILSVQGNGQDKLIHQTSKLVIVTLLTPVNASKHERGGKKSPLGGPDGHSAIPDILGILWKQNTDIHINPSLIPNWSQLVQSMPSQSFCIFILILSSLARRARLEVGIVIRYRLDGPGIESQWGRDLLHPSRLALGPTQPPIQQVPGLSRG
jgi:hypothetical protein